MKTACIDEVTSFDRFLIGEIGQNVHPVVIQAHKVESGITLIEGNYIFYFLFKIVFPNIFIFV